MAFFAPILPCIFATSLGDERKWLAQRASPLSKIQMHLLLFGPSPSSNHYTTLAQSTPMVKCKILKSNKLGCQMLI